MIGRVRYVQQGGHVHCRVFTGTSENSLAKCGDLVFREGADWDWAMTAFECGGFEVVPEVER